MTQNPQNPDSPDFASSNGSPASQDPANLFGMSAAAAKEYLFGFVATLKLAEKELLSLEEETAKWKGRADLARSKEMADLAAQAEKEADSINTRLDTVREEAQTLKGQIDSMRRQLPGLAARERSIDPDLLEQELLMALGQTEEQVKTEKAFRELEKENTADAALEALKAKMKG